MGLVFEIGLVNPRSPTLVTRVLIRKTQHINLTVLRNPRDRVYVVSLQPSTVNPSIHNLLMLLGLEGRPAIAVTEHLDLST